MNYITQLEQLLKTDVLLEVEANIKEIQAELLKKKSKALKEELEYMQNVKLYFDEVLIDIQKNLLTQEDALDILEGLEDMKAENQEI